MITSPAPDIMRLPIWMRCQGCAVPSTALYWHIGETTTRFSRSRPPIRPGLKSALIAMVPPACSAVLVAAPRMMVDWFSAANTAGERPGHIHECEISLRKCVLFDSAPGGRELSRQSIAAGRSRRIALLRRRQSMLGLMQGRGLLISGPIEEVDRCHTAVEFVRHTVD